MSGLIGGDVCWCEAPERGRGGQCRHWPLAPGSNLNPTFTLNTGHGLGAGTTLNSGQLATLQSAGLCSILALSAAAVISSEEEEIIWEDVSNQTEDGCFVMMTA